MARGKHKKSAKKQNLPQRDAQAREIKAPGQKIDPPVGKTDASIPKTRQIIRGNARASVSVPVFFAGMFLTLILGIYLGTLLPEMNRPKPPAQPDSMPAQSQPAPMPPRAAGKAPADKTSPSLNASRIPARYADEVKTLLDDLIREPGSVKTWIQLGNVYFDAQMPREAIDAYSRALAIEPANADVLTDMGVMYREMGDYRKAMECFHSASGVNPRHAESLYNAGLVLAHDLHDNNGARKAWEALLKINPDAVSPHGEPVSKMIEELN